MARDVAKKGAAAAGRMSQRAADISVRVAESIVRRVGPAAGACPTLTHCRPAMMALVPRCMCFTGRERQCDDRCCLCSCNADGAQCAAGFARAMKAGGQSRREAAQEIAAASLVAAVEIYVSMEEAARVVLASSGQAGSELVAHACVPLPFPPQCHACALLMMPTIRLPWPIAAC